MASLPSDLHALAAQDGYVSCVAVTAADGGNGWAGLVAFFDTESSPEYEFGHALVEIIELLQLAVKQREDKLELWRAARHDPLTGLYNRTGLLEWLAAPLARPGAGTAMLFVDLDGFKSVNDTHGHGVGDTVLRDVAGRLAEAAPDAVIARLGGDEFAIVVTDLPAHGAHPTLDALAERVFLATSTPVEIPDALPMVLGASIGITFVVDGDDAGRLLDRADRAMYEAKAAGGGWSFA